jgi:CDGSH-type Zn-finger protein
MTSKKEISSTNVKKTRKIKVTTNGPYLVYGEIPVQHQEIVTDPKGIPVKWLTTAKHPPQEICALCRCGQSKNKPFCDGTHAKVGFDGAETANQESYLDKPEVIDGPALKLIDVKELCASARFCHRAGEIWNLVPKSGDPEAKRIAQEESCDCPSGRLIVQDKKTGKIVEPKLEPSISLIEDPDMGVSGPIWVRGGIPVESADGKTYRIRNRITLCRCGKSSNKPFCDSSHFPDEPQQPEG